jgi:hypothetical protein
VPAGTRRGVNFVGDRTEAVSFGNEAGLGLGPFRAITAATAAPAAAALAARFAILTQRRAGLGGLEFAVLG